MSYMAKEKSNLRKLEKSFVRRKKLYEARQVNRKFQKDPGSVYSYIGKMLEKQQENEKPRYDRTLLHLLNEYIDCASFASLCLYFTNCNKYCQHIGRAHKWEVLM